MFSLPRFLLLMVGSVLTFRAGGGNGRSISGLVYVSVWSLFPRRCQWLWTESHLGWPHPLILCTTRASIQVAMTLLDLGAPSILMQSQDRQVQNWAFLRLNSTWTLLIFGRGFLQMEPKGLPWHDGWYFLCPREPKHVRSWWTEKKEPQL